MRLRIAGDAGSVTAETAVVLPAVVLVLSVCVWVVGLVGAQLRCVEAARAGARAAARGEADEEVVARVRESLGGSAEVSLQGDDGVVVVGVRLRFAPPGLLAALLRSQTVGAEATAELEPGADG